MNLEFEPCPFCCIAGLFAMRLAKGAGALITSRLSKLIHLRHEPCV